ncbi:hypothetical protein LOTGIDRAFT_231402 [Lottia gigantea]|uniref:BZIP domain-containing protein n=1 Tax=Lottia gigantea TaxID=225164 RepID=V4AMH2_LOTGI|nr:hypothetical protein LOTGIDRAFT_231402 [Lottia gigantea]ESO98332.1 hypothetical protein LOTGIDRAFT_231402 [Lottia gigantea]
MAFLTLFQDSESSMTGSFDDSNEDDDSSDEEFSDGEMDMSHLNNTSVLEDGKKGEKFFWQYNVQSKGPKGTKLKLHLDSKNPHKLKNFEDPVFDPNNTKSGIRHGGKARKGDGNDIVPSPRKLFSLGVQIRRLNHMINEISANNDQSASKRNELRKKKNKLASRACRLKKKAQHEANKVKLFGIGKEHSQLIEVIKTIKGELKKKARDVENETLSNKENLISTLDRLIANKLTDRIAGNTTVYVNSVIKTVEGGDTTGGIPSARK